MPSHVHFVNYYIDCRQLFSARCEISSLGIGGDLFQVACIIITNEFCRRKGGGGGESGVGQGFLSQQFLLYC